MNPDITEGEVDVSPIYLINNKTCISNNHDANTVQNYMQIYYRQITRNVYLLENILNQKNVELVIIKYHSRFIIKETKAF